MAEWLGLVSAGGAGPAIEAGRPSRRVRAARKRVLYEARRIRCSKCGYAASADAVWAIDNLCPRCLSPLSLSLNPPPPAPAAAGPDDRLAQVLSGWVDAFNDRDLDEMLARMSPQVEFHPLRLGRADGGYRGHGGVCEWFELLMADDRRHTIQILELRDAGRSRVIALGKLHLEPDADTTPFWALDRFSDGLIVAAHHYLADRDLLEDG